ncbi:MAG: fibrobacter succinogenes major paralogous domain-containing protein [Bacteroidota bacterium]
MENTTKIIFTFILLFIGIQSTAQLGISATNTPPNTSAMLDVSSTSKGLLIPRMTSAERTGIPTPAQGLNVFDTQTKTFWYYDGIVWREMDTSSITTLPYYSAVTICCQSWMTRNLEVTSYRNGDPIPQITDPTAWSELTTGAWCYYNNDPTNGSIYGKLYNWYAVNDPRGLAPEGWHVPTDFEWTTLTNCLGGEGAAGGLMKEIGITHWTTPNTDATNFSGFIALPGGFRASAGTFSVIGGYGYLWSATLLSINNITAPLYRTAYYINGTLSRGSGSLRSGFSVRCIRD